MQEHVGTEVHNAIYARANGRCECENRDANTLPGRAETRLMQYRCRPMLRPMRKRSRRAAVSARTASNEATRTIGSSHSFRDCVSAYKPTAPTRPARQKNYVLALRFTEGLCSLGCRNLFHVT